jgi:hypothetical protein
MRTKDIFGGAEPERDDHLRAVMGTRKGRSTLLYILTQMNMFGNVETETEKAAHNAAVRLLADITARTGYELDINFIR